jgi:hypothetical protein
LQKLVPAGVTAFQPEAKFIANDFRSRVPFYEKYKFAARENPPALKHYINFAIYTPAAKK